jgi:hypothetical protein
MLGYARVPTTDQQPQLQVDALQRAGCYRAFVETASGAHAEASHRHDVRSSERGHAVSAVDVGVGPWKGPGRERRTGGSAVAFDEFIKPADDGELLG